MTVRTPAWTLADETIHEVRDRAKNPIPMGARPRRTIWLSRGVIDAKRSMKIRNATANKLPAANAARIIAVVLLSPCPPGYV